MINLDCINAPMCLEAKQYEGGTHKDVECESCCNFTHYERVESDSKSYCPKCTSELTWHEADGDGYWQCECGWNSIELVQIPTNQICPLCGTIMDDCAPDVEAYRCNECGHVEEK